MTYSPLRYPGGKSSLYDFLKRTLEVNEIVDGYYAEPYAGGAGAALKLLILEDVYEIYLNDKDELIYKFWNSVLNHTDELVKKISDTEVNLNEWNRQKQIFNLKNQWNEFSDVDLGYTAFFLNRCNRSGILKAGVIGGKNQEGEYKIDARFNKIELIDRIQRIALYRDRIKLSNKDAIVFLNDLSKEFGQRKDMIIYLDPPYVNQGEGLYNDFYQRHDHVKLAQYIQKQVENLWLISYDDDPLIHQVYKEVNKNIFEFNYFASKTKVGRELLICSKNCKMPATYEHYSREKPLSNSYIVDIGTAI